MSIEKLGLDEAILRAVREAGYETATPIQSQAIPMVLAGHDLMGCAQTGTGKTAAFALPTLNKLCQSKATQKPAKRAIRGLIVAPTRELAVQIAASFAKYGKHTKLRATAIFGGVGQNPQVRALQAGVDVLIATPGRLLDLMNQRHVDLSKVEILILDEADQMLDMGFLPDMRRIVAATPKQRQTLMFSATMPEEIRRLAAQWLKEPQHVQITPAATPVDSIKQSVYFVDARKKPQMLTQYLQNSAWVRAMVFVRTKHGADKLAKHLVRTGVRAEAIHGNKSQNARTRALDRFRSKQPPVLVATDVAARGLDVPDVSHVVNYELPEVPEIYVHRIGRTGRAGAEGIATSFCGGDERGRLRDIERLTRHRISVEEAGPEFAVAAEMIAAPRSGGSDRGAKPPRRKRRRAQPGRKPQVAAAKQPASAGRARQGRRRRRAL